MKWSRSTDQSRSRDSRPSAPVLKVLHLTFDQIDWREEFDGVWACASLLHLPSPQLQIALNRMIGGLRRGGVLYVSLKEGHLRRACQRSGGLHTRPQLASDDS